MTRVDQPSLRVAERHLLDLRKVIRQGRKLNRGYQVWPAGLDRSILRTLPLNVRTWNCLQSAHLMQGDDPITVEQLLDIPNFGKKSLRDFLLTVEDFLSRHAHVGDADSNEAGKLGEQVRTHHPEEVVAPTARTDAPRTSWERLEQILSPILAAAAELHGAKTLAEVLSPEFMHLASRLGTADSIRMIAINDATKGMPGLVSDTLSRLSMTLAAASDADRIIIEQRLLRAPGATLEEIGSQLGVTRERIRQLQIKIEKQVQNALGKDGRIIAQVLKEQFDSIVPQGETDQRIDEIIPADQSLATKLLRKILIDEMGFTLDAGMYLDESAAEQLQDIQAATRKFADDVGLLNEQQFVASLPDEQWRRFWPWVRRRCGLHELFGSLAIRDSGKARAKAALILIGRPATREEIARICGFGENKTGSHLSVIPSVVKADKDRWGLEDWVDDEYEGIAGEIIQRIEEDGGATTTERLLKELPDKFGVDPMSVRAYMQTPKFMIRDGWISLAHPQAIRLRDLDDVIDGRNRDGAPYWTFVVESRFLEGYSVAGVPPEFAKALGCAPDAGARVRIDNLPDRFELSVRWPLASTTGASLGYLAAPLKHLGIEPGQRARVTIKGPCLVELAVDEGNAGESQASGADAILKRMMKRRELP